MRGEIYRLDLTRVNLHDSDSRSYKLLPQAIGEASDGSLRSTVDTTAGVRFPSRDTADVDDVALAAIWSLEENGHDGLCHVDESSDVDREHEVHVILGDFWCFGYAFDQAAVL
jgi:hypothetical protein